MILPYACQREVVIASKRSSRSFGHWNDRALARPDPARPKPGAASPASSGRYASPSRRSGGTGPADPVRLQWNRPGSAEDTRTRLELLAQRREDGELMRELADSADVDELTPSAATRSRLRALANRMRTDAPEPGANAENPEEHLWNRVLGIAAPMVTFEPPDRRVR